MSPDKIPSWFNELCSIFPCMIQRVQGNGFNIEWGKIAQSLVVVAIIAASTSFVTVKVLEIKFDQLEVKFTELKYDIKEDIVEIKKDIKGIKKNNYEFEKEMDEAIDSLDKNIDEVANNLNDIEDNQKEFDIRLGKLEDKK